MAEAGRNPVCLDQDIQTRSCVAHDREVLREGVGPLAEKALDLGGVGKEVKRPFGRLAAAVEAANHLQGTRHVRLVVIVERNAVVHEAGDLPATVHVLVDERLVDAEPLGDALGEGLALTADDLLGADAGVTIDVFGPRDREPEREVCQTLLDGHDTHDVAPRARERRADVVEDLGVHVLEEVLVEAREVRKRVELEDDARLVAPHGHAKVVEVLPIDVLPEFGGRVGAVVLLLEDAHELPRERTVEVDVTEHRPSVMATDGHCRDSTVASGGETVFARGALEVRGGVVGLVDVTFEDVLREVVIRGADVGVAETLADEHQRRVVVALGVVGVDGNPHPELLLEVEERLLHVSHDDGDVIDPGLAELANLPLDEYLAAHAQKTLGLLVRERHEAAGETRRHDDGIVHTIRGKGGLALRGESAAVHETHVLELSDQPIDGSDRHPRRLCSCSLRRAGVLIQRIKDLEFVSREGHRFSFYVTKPHGFGSGGRARIREIYVELTCSAC